MNLASITYNDRTLFHMLRHFESINQTAKTCLMNRGYTNQDMDAAFQMPGSRFYADFAQDLKTLEQQWEYSQLISEAVIGNYLYAQLGFDLVQYPKGIGSLGVLPLSELAQLGKIDLEEKANRGLLLKHAKLDKLPPTWEMTLILKPQKNYHLLITAFPGSKTLPLPNKKMKEADLQASIRFWEEHVFLETPKLVIDQ